jgi:hypothetical protein
MNGESCLALWHVLRGIGVFNTKLGLESKFWVFSLVFFLTDLSFQLCFINLLVPKEVLGSSAGAEGEQHSYDSGPLL